MTIVKCAHCGNERDLTYDQIRNVATENRECPSCGIGKERVVIREERFQPLSEYVKETPRSVTTVTVGRVTPDTSGSDHEIEESGIRVGPGGGIQRRPRKSEK